MFKKFYILFLVAIVSSCRTPIISSTSSFSETSATHIDEQSFITSESFRVGVLLPLTGEASKIGQGLKQSTMLALEDMNNSNLILQFYDTHSSPEGARVAAENAINQRVKMIIGPLMSTEVAAISDITRRHDIPVITFSTNEAVLLDHIYTIGLLIEEQIDRIVSYATSQGKSRFALLIPDNANGIAVAKSALAATQKRGASVVKIAFYPPETTDFSEIIRQLSDFDSRSQPIKKEKQRLLALVKNGDSSAKQALKKLNLKETARGVDFDALIIPETGGRLKSAAAMFGYYDVFAPDVMFLGTSVWENTSLNNEAILNKAVYPRLSRNHNDYFNKKYMSLFGNYPNSLYAFAYDAVALSSVLARRNPSNLEQAITNPDGFSGINGVFRFFNNGKNQHSLDIIRITPSADVVIDSAPDNFAHQTQSSYDADIANLYDNMPPVIFGKDNAEAQNQIFGRQLNFSGNQNSDAY